MNKSAIIVASAAEERRSIAKLLKPNGFFSAIHFSGTFEEVSFLLGNTHINILFCDVSVHENENLKLTAKLAALAEEYGIELVFFSHLDPVELPLLGFIPANSHCLSYDSSPSSATALIKRLLDSGPTTTLPIHLPTDKKLIDQSSGIYSRFYFDTFLDQELSRSKLTGRPFSLLLIEPQALQPSTMNQAWGTLLPAMALAIKDQIRTSDLLCRIENTRLALVLPETTTINARRVIHRIMSKIQEGVSETPFNLKIGLASPSLSNHYNRHGMLTEAEASL